MTFPYGQAATVDIYAAPETDSAGNEIPGTGPATSAEYSGVVVYPFDTYAVGAREDTARFRDYVPAALTAIFPVGADVPIGKNTRVTVSGETWYVAGAAADYSNPFTGLEVGPVVHLTRSEG